ncbi:MAG: GDSL-type esterase/lipase family protein, partial [Rudanella sp.]|nr:GDSL-type esterase/lipase family protein [Rudanella sp.]
MDSLEEEVRQLEHTLAQYPPHTVVFYGSSTVRLWTRLAQAFPQVQVLNAGFGGSTLEACGWYFERLIVPAQPRAVILYAGDNDLGNDRKPEEVYLFFCALADKMQRHLPNVPLIYVSIKPSPARWAIITQIRAANTFIAAEISRLPNTTFIDLTDAMLTPDGQPRPDLFEVDGLHLNPVGYALWQKL